MDAFVAFAKRYAIALGGTGYAFTLGLRSARHRRLVHSLALHFGYREAAPAPVLPTVSVAEVTRDDTPVLLREPVARNGNVTLLELLVLARLVRERSPKAIFEIGTFDGRTTLNLAANAPADAEVFTLDLPPDVPTALSLAQGERRYVNKPASGARFAGTELAPRIRQLHGDSASFDFSPYPVDFFFVDGSHAYEYALHDSHTALRALRGRRGTIVWHDYGQWEGVTRALNELARGDPAFAGMRHVRGTTLVVLTRE
jgi:hypothetical protein